MKSSTGRKQKRLLNNLLAVAAIFILVFVPGCSYDSDNNSDQAVKDNRPTPNPYLSSTLYGITHFDSSQSDSRPYGPPRDAFYRGSGYPTDCLWRSGNIITLVSTHNDYMWGVGTNQVRYIHKGEGVWTTLAVFQALADATSNCLPAIPDETLR